MTNSLTTITEVGLTEIGGEPRARDLDLGERLGLKRPRVIRDMIKNNIAEFERFGSLAVQDGKSRGQVFHEFWLNEEQALLAAVLSDAPNAPAVRAMLIKTFVAWRRGHLPAVDQQSLARQIAAIVDDKLSRSTNAMVTHMLPNAVAGYMAEHHMLLADGLSAGEVCDLSNVADKYPRGIPCRVANRLNRFCKANGALPWYTRVGRVRVKAYPTHLAREWLEIEGRALIRRWYQDKVGQSALRLVGGRAA